MHRHWSGKGPGTLGDLEGQWRCAFVGGGVGEATIIYDILHHKCRTKQLASFVQERIWYESNR